MQLDYSPLCSKPGCVNLVVLSQTAGAGLQDIKALALIMFLGGD